MAPTIDTSAFVTREELEARIASIMRSFETNTNSNQNNSNNRQNNQNQNRGDQKHGK